MSDYVRMSLRVEPVVEMTDGDAANHYAPHADSGPQGVAFDLTAQKIDVNLSKSITSTSGQTVLTYITYDYQAAYIEHTGKDSSGDASTIAVRIEIDGGANYSIKLTSGQSVLIPFNALTGSDLLAKLASAGDVVLKVIGVYET